VPINDFPGPTNNPLNHKCEEMHLLPATSMIVPVVDTERGRMS
jgi:hypothetical protein